MEVYRLSRGKYAVPLSGKGASSKGARWNSIGTELIYFAKNRSLAMAEVAVHLSLSTLPRDYVLLTVHIPDDISTYKINKRDLPVDWNVFPHPSSTQTIGDEFVTRNEFCVLEVPSSVTQGDHNLLVNPNHPDFSKLKVINQEPFIFDDRIFKIKQQ